MSLYTWAWSDEESTYINNAESLFEIVETVVGYYFDEDQQYYKVSELNGKFSISITVDASLEEYEVNASVGDINEFLHILARHEDRPDTFAIRLDQK